MQDHIIELLSLTMKIHFYNPNIKLEILLLQETPDHIITQQLKLWWLLVRDRLQDAL